MNAIKVLLVGLVFAVGCSAAEDFDAYEADEPEFGFLEQPVSYPYTQNYGPGFLNTLEAPNCTRTTPSGNTCLVPSGLTTGNKTVGVCFGSGFSTAQKDAIRQGIQRADNPTNWTFTEVGQGCDLNFLSGFSVGGNSTSQLISAYRLIEPTGLATLSESLPATFKSFTAINCKLDTADIAARSANSLQILAHIGGNCAGASMGLGTRTEAPLSGGSATVMSNNITPFTQHLGLTAGEACRASGITFTNPGVLTTSQCQTGD